MIYIILTAYNEEAGLGRLLTKISQLMPKNSYSYRVLIVNDGSTDGTLGVVREYAKKMPLDLIDYKINQGVSQAFRDAFQKVISSSEDSDIIVTMDADDTHDTDLIKPIVEKIREGNDIVLASCYAKEGKIIGLSFYRSVLSRGCNFIYRIFFPIPDVTLYTGFYRGYKAEALKKTEAAFKNNFIESSGFGVMAELLVKFRKLNLKISEIPMTIRYDLKESKSKIKIFKTINEHLTSIFKNIYNNF